MDSIASFPPVRYTPGIPSARRTLRMVSSEDQPDYDGEPVRRASRTTGKPANASAPSLQLWPELACEIGVDEAIFVAQLDYWLARSGNARDGYTWVYNTLAEWLQQFPFWKQTKLHRVIESLKADGVIVTTAAFNDSGSDRTLWYRLNAEHPALVAVAHRLTSNPNKCQEPSHFPNPENQFPQTENPFSESGNSIFQERKMLIEQEITQEITQKNTPPSPPRRKSETEQRDHDVVAWWCKTTGSRQPADKGAALNAAHALLAAGFTLDTLPGLYEHVKAKATVGATLPMLVKWADGYQAKQTPAKPVDDERPELKAGPGRMLCVERKDVVIRRKTTLLPEMQAKYDERIAEIDAKLDRLGVTVQEAEAWALRH